MDKNIFLQLIKTHKDYLFESFQTEIVLSKVGIDWFESTLSRSGEEAWERIWNIYYPPFQCVGSMILFLVHDRLGQYCDGLVKFSKDDERWNILFEAIYITAEMGGHEESIILPIDEFMWDLETGEIKEEYLCKK